MVDSYFLKSLMELLESKRSFIKSVKELEALD